MTLPVSGRDWAAFGVVAVISVVLSPITAVWAVLVGLVVVLTGWTARWSGLGWGNPVALAGAGMAAGTLPYFFEWALLPWSQSARIFSRGVCLRRPAARRLCRR